MILLAAGIALIVDYADQVIENSRQGLRGGHQFYHENIDEGEMVGAAAGGAATAAFVLATGPTTYAGTLLAWTGGGLVGGQTGRFVHATWDEAHIGSYL